MNTDGVSGDEPPDDSEVQEPEALDDLIAGRAECTRQAAAATRPIQDMAQARARTYRFALEALHSQGMRAAMDAAARQQKLLQDITGTSSIRLATELRSSPGIQAATRAADQGKKFLGQWANSPAARLAAELADTWQRFQDHTAVRLSETIQSIHSASRQVWPWVSKAAESVGKTISAIYRQAAPRNWTNGDSTPSVSYNAAAALALEEGIPLAWVPDYETIRLLLAVPTGPDRRTALRAILTDRSTLILNHCQVRLDNSTMARARRVTVGG
ncbi:MAG TPA: hypothetical protein VJ870_11395 [Amycolatopsis sp.]|nr:hypothetical protein [Amycolatopsis sp.]